MLKRKEFILGAAAGLLVAAGATAGGVISWPGAHAETMPGQIVASAGAAGLAFAPPQGAPLSFADIVQQVAPAVVQIEVETPVERPTGMQGFQIPGLPGFVVPQQQQEDPDAEPQLARGAGSGFFISADGYIVTNNHVVADATSIKVVLTDGRTLDAKLIGRDENTDLAVIKVEGSAFSFVSFEEQAEPRVGDWVVAVGNPFGLGGTATAGIVSAKGRNIDEDEATRNYVDFLQIDAAINRGNSGGPTFDIYGRVIGVNSAIISPGASGGSVGIGFAIPASVAKPITDRLIASGSIERGYLGVAIQDVTPQVRGSLGLPDDFKGAFIGDVTAGAPAARAGLKIEDIVVSLNGQPVAGSTALTRAVGEAKVGDTLRLEILREGRRQTVNVVAGRRPPQAELQGGDAQPDALGGKETPGQGGQTVEGVQVNALNAAARQRYSIPDDVEGVVVTAVTPRSKAAEIGLPIGSVIVRANNRPVSTPAELQTQIAAARGAGRPGVLLLVHIAAGNRSIVLELAPAE